MINAKTQKSQIPQNAFEFTAPCQLAAGQDADGKRRATLTAYDGGVHYHWYWGNLAFDLKGITLSKKKMPMLFDHDTEQRIGVLDAAAFDSGAVFEGEFLNNDAAAKLLADADAGFPFEASWRFDPWRSEYRFIERGQVETVNGKTLKGPGTVFTKTAVMEVSVVVFGALNKTKTEIFEHTFNERTPTMNEEQLKAQHPDLHAQVFAAGVADGQKQAVERFAAVRAACGDDAELACDSFAAGLDKTAALEKRNAKLAEALKAKDQTIAQLSAAPQPPAAPAAPAAAPVSPAATEFADDAAHNPAAGHPSAPRDAADVSAMSDKQLIAHCAGKTDAELKAMFAANPKLAEFGSEKAFVLYVRKGAEGKLR